MIKTLRNLKIVYILCVLLFYLYSPAGVIYLETFQPYYNFNIFNNELSYIITVAFFVSIFLLHNSYIYYSIILGIISVLINFGDVSYSLIIILSKSSEIDGILLGLGFYMHLISFLPIIMINLFLIFLKLKQGQKANALIKKTILELGTKYPRIEIEEIADKCGELPDLVIKVVQIMIQNNEIYATYFKTSQTVAFNQQANIKEIDQLMERYNDWETTELKKKIA